MSLDGSGYSGLVLEKLAAAGAKIGDTITIRHDTEEHTGILMPRAQIGSDPDHIVVKLTTGYNLGIRLTSPSEVILVKKGRTTKRTGGKDEPEQSKGLPAVSILSTGGTIASKVDYRTGAVNPALTAQDLYDTVPELKDHANVRAKVLMSVFSEDIKPSDWTKMARAVASEIKQGADGIIIAHGTDTLGFTSAALSFALQNLPVPVALVGSQRSSDRPSSDAAMNLILATDFVGRVDAAEVMLVMHGETDDSFALAHRGTRVRKSHTSRRDAFQSINTYPLFRVSSSSITEMNPPLLRRDPDRTLKLKPKFEEKVAIVRTYPGLSHDVVDHLVDYQYKGIVIEGTGLGHAPKAIQSSVKHAIDAGVVVAMTSQCISGRVNMDVYRTGVELLDLGVVACEDMLTETTFVKLSWLLANMKTIDKITAALTTPLSGEIEMRSEMAEYSVTLEEV
ncbi:MAG: Glu-tRNA(Gln) amidotransferase subunit GatD [Candidatus Thorarchaeota archaeon]